VIDIQHFPLVKIQEFLSIDAQGYDIISRGSVTINYWKKFSNFDLW
jgi:hypothetical protein